MNKYFFVASALVCVSVSAIADVVGGNVFGILKVESKTADTIVAVPWCECSTNDNEAVAISNIVKTANLTVGDELYSLNNSRKKLYKWVLAESDGVKYWQGYRMVSNSGTVDNAIPSASATAARGTAIILHRQNPTNSVGNANAFYLYGQVGTTATVPTTIGAGSAETPAYTLIAPPGTSDVDVLANDVLTGFVANDSIVVRGDAGMNREFTYDGTDWKYTKTSYVVGTGVTTASYVTNSIVLKCGTGAWYISRNSTAPTLEWKNVPKK